MIADTAPNADRSDQRPFNGESTSTRKDIILWWEQRRLRYNLWVGIVGTVTWCLVMTARSASVKPGIDFEEPILMFVGPVLYGIMANLCFTLGWVVDVAAYRGSPRENLFRAGLWFSLALTAVPGIWAVLAWLITLHTGKKMG